MGSKFINKCLTILIFCASVAMFVIVNSCTTKAFPDERMAIDPTFLNLFNSILQKDTFSFHNSKGESKVFVITKIDSAELNKRGWFINGGPFRTLHFSFREIGKDTAFLDRYNEVSITKAPSVNVSSITIQFNNFFYSDTVLPRIIHDSLTIGEKKIIDYYLFRTPLNLKNSYDVKELYLSSLKGILGFKTIAGDVWINKNE